MEKGEIKHWNKYSDEHPSQNGVFKCKMKDGTEKELILIIENDWNENTLEDVYWYHWFESEEDIKNWSTLDVWNEPEYWMFPTSPAPQ